MGLIGAAGDAIGGTLADQWVEFFTAPEFDEKTVIAPADFQGKRWGRGVNRRSGENIISDGSRIAVPENTALVVTDGGEITDASVQPGYFVYRNDGQPSVFAGGGIGRSLIEQSWNRFRFGGLPGRQQLASFVNLREIRGLGFGTPSPMPYKDFSLVPPGSTQAPVLRLKARGVYSVRVVDPIRFFKTFLPANQRSYDLADSETVRQLTQEFLTAFQAALQTLSRTTDIASLAMHGPELAAAMTSAAGPGGSWLERFGLEIVSVAVSAVDYDTASRELMDKYNKGAMLGGSIGNAYTQTTVADAAFAAGQSGGGVDGLVGVAWGTGAMGAAMGGMTQPEQPAQADPVVVLRQLKDMLDQGLITQEMYTAKQQEILGRM
ncbi:membrane protease subunit (stomatin/prohibitin family) [Aeromicrobium sp. SORGH_AS981]|uniref:SPFH domain-containing protein n=1 Tax=Aeromicrobium sp. SORGH_AS_0981 TaxID=3041802 RepID=UPI002859250A|nr:SPFH domain-containing protein [Aeromicrobium sp. SORGH_AS_0981]MDR6119716.1 membrane protease subunit (stomatin/prohibitin family) [Aeromicrobium sp. SORGH_AS_0981]